MCAATVSCSVGTGSNANVYAKQLQQHNNMVGMAWAGYVQFVM
jgi:hypothetical protein